MAGIDDRTSDSNGNSDNWSFVLADERYSTFEDPFSGTPVPKREFDAVYGPACLEVFQCCITVDMLFSANPVMCGEWRFADDDARADLYDVAIELGLVASSEEVCAGETEEEKACRNVCEAVSRAQQQFGGRRESSGLEVRGGILSRGAAWARDDDDGVTFEDSAPASKPRKSGPELQAELERVLAEFEFSGLSNKRRKKLERRRRGILSALESSDEGVVLGGSREGEGD